MNERTKVVLLGPEKAGKTQLCNAFKGEPVSDAYEPTISQNFFSIYPFNIWDISGAEKFLSLRAIFLKDAKTVLIVIDAKSVNEGKTKTKLQPFLDLVNTKKEQLDPDAKIYWVVTKMDKVPNGDERNAFEEKCEVVREDLKQASPDLPWINEIIYCSAATPGSAGEVLDIISPKEPEGTKLSSLLKNVSNHEQEQNNSTLFTAWLGALKPLLPFFLPVLLSALLATLFLTLGGVAGGLEHEWFDIHDFFNAMFHSATPWGMGVFLASMGLAVVISGLAVLIYDHYTSADGNPGGDNKIPDSGTSFPENSELPNSYTSIYQPGSPTKFTPLTDVQIAQLNSGIPFEKSSQ